MTLSKHEIILTKLSALDDPRRKQRKVHSLEIILFIALCSMLAGGESFYAMEMFARANEAWLKEYAKMENVPSHDTFNRVFKLMANTQLRKLLMETMSDLRTVKAGDVIAVDGKSLRGTGKDKDSILQMLNIWSVENGIALGHMPIQSKSNEIPAVQEILEYIDVTDCVITTDAINCQTKTAEKIISKCGDYVLAVKKNHQKLFEDVKLFMDDLATKNEPDFCQCGKDHGRIETRKVWQTCDISWYDGAAKWAGLQSFCMVEATRDFGDKIETERRYFISSLSYAPERVAMAIRRHWHVENSLHWVLDVTFNEDKCRARAGNAAKNLATMRVFALNLLKLKKDKNTIVNRRHMCGWSNEYLMDVLSLKV